MAAVAGAVDVEDAAAVVTVVVVVAEAAAIVKGTKKRSFRYGGRASLRARSHFPCAGVRLALVARYEPAKFPKI
jgi:hypothetical protein